MKIGIIGKGFVGSAVQFGFSPNTGCDAQVKIYDQDPNRSQHSLQEVLDSSGDAKEEEVELSFEKAASSDDAGSEVDSKEASAEKKTRSRTSTGKGRSAGRKTTEK